MRKYSLLFILIALGVLSGSLYAYIEMTPVRKGAAITEPQKPALPKEREDSGVTQKQPPPTSRLVPQPPPFFPSTLPPPAPPSERPAPVQEQESIDKPPLKLKSIGVDLDYYDPATGRAGDFMFTSAQLNFGLIFFDYGYIIPANMSASGNDKTNPQPTFLVPMGTKVHSLVDGIVVATPTLYSGDYSIQVAPSENSNWRYETEHVINPLVKVGDRVRAGQIIAEVSPHDSQKNAGFGLVEIGILFGGSTPQHICPFAHLDGSIKDDIEKKITAFYKSWEDYRGSTTLYNESNLASPGCRTLAPIEG